jgi:hypothetical protein
MGYGQIRLSKGVSGRNEKSPGFGRGLFVSISNYRKLDITNPPTFKENYLLYYVLIGEISTDLGA